MVLRDDSIARRLVYTAHDTDKKNRIIHAALLGAGTKSITIRWPGVLRNAGDFHLIINHMGTNVTSIGR